MVYGTVNKIFSFKMFNEARQSILLLGESHLWELQRFVPRNIYLYKFSDLYFTAFYLSSVPITDKIVRYVNIVLESMFHISPLSKHPGLSGYPAFSFSKIILDSREDSVYVWNGRRNLASDTTFPNHWTALVNSIIFVLWVDCTGLNC